MIRRLIGPGLTLGAFLIATNFLVAANSVYGQTAWPVYQQAQGTPGITDTPQSDGSYVHVVHKGETLAGIAQAYGVSIDQIREYNDLPAGSTSVSPGTPLLIRIGEPTATLPLNATVMIVTATYTPVVKFVIVTATYTPKPVDLTASAQPTVTPSPTTQPSATPMPVTPSPPPTLVPIGSSASLCITAFNDANTNHWFDSGETLIPGVALTVLLQTADGKQQPQQATTTADGASCFSNIAPGVYSVDAKAPDGFGPTTPTELNVQVAAGAHVSLSFGAAQGYQPPQPDATSAQAAPSPTPVAQLSASLFSTISQNIGLLVLGVAAIVLLGGLSVIFIARRQ